MAKKNKSKQKEDPIERELLAIKRLLMVLLVKTGVTLSELALALKMDQADVSRMMPIRKIKKYKDK